VAKKWYTLRVISGQENKVKAHLENNIELKGMEEFFGRIIVPSQPVLEMHNGKKRIKNKVFFPGYILIEMEYNNKTAPVVQETPGVIGFVGPKNKPQEVKPEEVEAILRKIEKLNVRKRRWKKWKFPFRSVIPFALLTDRLPILLVLWKRLMKRRKRSRCWLVFSDVPHLWS